MKFNISIITSTLLLSSLAYADPGTYTYRITNTEDPSRNYDLTATTAAPTAIFSDEKEIQYVKSCQDGFHSNGNIITGRRISLESRAASSGNSNNASVKIVMKFSKLADMQTAKNENCLIQLPNVENSIQDATVSAPPGKRVMFTSYSNSGSKTEWYVERLN